MTETLAHRGEINALLGRGTEFEGKLCFEGRVRIDGKFRGEIHADDTLVLGDGADVDADVHVARLIVRGGTLRGHVHASEVVELFAPAKVYADLVTASLFLDRGVHFEGRCTMEGGGEVKPQPLDEPQRGSSAPPDIPVGVAVPEGASLPPPDSDDGEGKAKRRRRRR